MDALHEGKDFKATVKRDLFEEKSAALFDLAPALVSSVIEQSGLKSEDVAALEYFGGGVRVPKCIVSRLFFFPLCSLRKRGRNTQQNIIHPALKTFMMIHQC